MLEREQPDKDFEDAANVPLCPIQLRQSLPRFKDQEHSPDPIVHIKFEMPSSGWTWFVTEGEPIGNEFLFFGFVIGFEAEWGYFSLSELEEVNVNGAAIERHVDFEPRPLSQCSS